MKKAGKPLMCFYSFDFIHLIWLSLSCGYADENTSILQKYERKSNRTKRLKESEVNWSEDVNTFRSLTKSVKTSRQVFQQDTYAPLEAVRSFEQRVIQTGDPDRVILSVRTYVTSTTCLSSSISGASSFSRLMIRPGDTHSVPLLLHQSKSHAQHKCLVDRMNCNVCGDPLTFLLEIPPAHVNSLKSESS